ncbi:BSD domain-containing [Cryptosporidium sp. chipmunk genotype I]|uniref:BSD domain-containing n=1 Tax=Cryptosporidium sp. chipmunk genotype I TaxID=1280935 RepID=UPI00351A1F53|nr:BSD domain-containing [Cryptosporidium sp. chipmunk genotype I]
MKKLEYSSKEDEILSKFLNVIFKKESGILYITRNNIIWISKKVNGQPFETVSALKESYLKIISEADNNLNYNDEVSPNKNNVNLANDFVVELWQNLYAHRKRDDKRLVGLRFENKEIKNKLDSNLFIDINLTLSSNDDFNSFLQLMADCHKKAIEKYKQLQELKEKKQAEKSASIESNILELNKVEKNKRIVIEKKAKPKESQSIYDDLNQLLRYKPELDQIYKSLVLTGSMSLESFIQMHRQDILLSKTQEKGVENSDFFLKKPPKVSITSSGGVDVTITADDLKSILEEMPSIKTKIREYVPHRLTEEEFWNRIIQSPLFFDLLGQKNTLVNNSDTLMIGEIPKGEELLCELNTLNNNNNQSKGISELLGNYVSSEINLLNNDTYKKTGYGTLINNDLNIASEKSANINTGFFERFNCHGAKILEFTTGNNAVFNRQNEMDSEYSQDYLQTEQHSSNTNSNSQILDINPVNFFSSSRNKLDVKMKKDDNNIKRVKFNFKKGNKNVQDHNSLFNNQISRNVLLNCTKQIQYEQINQLGLFNKHNLIQEKSNEIDSSSQIFFEIQNPKSDISINNIKEEKPIWLQQIHQEHIQAIELLKYFWGLSLSPKDSDERRKTIESLNKITHNIELLVHDNKNISASSLSTFGQSSNTIRSICLPILETIKSARNFHIKLDEIINSLSINK